MTHGGVANDCHVQITYIDAEEIEKDGIPDELLRADGLLIPGGFGKRGGEGKVQAIKHARENNQPFLGICLGLQMAVVEYARNKAGIKSAASAEFEPKSKDPVIDLMEEQKNVTEKGGTMRLGAWDCKIKKDSTA